MTDTLTPAELAAFDQRWRTINHAIDAFIAVYRTVTADSHASREADLICFAAALETLIAAHSYAELLACAVTRLAERTPTP